MVLLLALLVLPAPTAGASAGGAPHSAPPARQSTAGLCSGRARRVSSGRISFAFSCHGEDVTGFVVQASRALHSVYDPSYAFGCSRSSSRSFACEDIHSGAGPQGSGILRVGEPLCPAGAHLVLRVTPSLNFEEQSLPAFTLRGPC